MTATDHEALARKRFFAIMIMRLMGALLAVAGLVILSGRHAAVSPWIGAAFLLIGLIDFAVIPLMLARRWRSPKDQ